MENRDQTMRRIQKRNNAVNNYLEKLNGITYEEWRRLSAIVDRSFDIEKEKLNKGIQLPNKELLDNATRLLFG